MSADAKHLTTFGPKAMSAKILSPALTGSMQRFSRMIRAKGAEAAPPPELAIPEAAGATDAELARLNHRPARALVAQSHRDAAWVHSTGIVLHR